jgi:hypothetical protein
MESITHMRSPSGRRATRFRSGLALSVALAVAALAPPGAAAESVSELNSQISSAQSQAESLAADIDAKAAEVAAARQQAAAAAQREAQLSGVLAQGEQRQAALEARVLDTRSRLVRARSELHRALATLAERLLSIYQGDAPDVTGLLLNARGFDELANRAELVGRIEEADASLAARVRELRNQVAAELTQVREARAEQIAFNQRIALARDQIASVRANAEARAAALDQARAEQAAAISSLRSQVAGWEQQVAELQQIQAQQSETAAATQAQETVSSWVGQWAIPQAIVMCESGGNFNAVNPSSGAGGAYQILPSTWQLYGGSGAPQDASPQEQSRIAAQIWADSGASAWECAQ